MEGIIAKNIKRNNKHHDCCQGKVQKKRNESQLIAKGGLEDELLKIIEATLFNDYIPLRKQELGVEWPSGKARGFGNL